MSTPADRLRQNRTSVATGKLTLDREQARRKLRLFRLPTPYMYVLQFVRAASVLGASAISFDIRAMTMICTFDATFEPELLEDIRSPMFEARTTVQQQAVHNLALGIASAQSLNPLQIEVRSGTTRLVLHDDSRELEEQDAEPLTTIRVDEKFRFGHVLDFVASLADVLPEASELRHYCVHSLMRVTVNGVVASHGFEVESVHGFDEPEVTDAESPLGMTRVMTSTDLSATTLVLLRDDVELAKLTRQPHLVGVRAALNSRTIATDLSGLRLQEAPDAVWDALTAAIHHAIYEWLRTHAEDVPRDDLFKELELLAAYIVERASTGIAPATHRLVEWFLAQPIFRSGAIVGTPRWVRLYQPEDGGAVAFSTKRVAVPEWTEDVLYLGPNSPVKRLLDRAQIPTIDVTENLVARSIYHQNHERWLQRAVAKRQGLEDAVDCRVVEVDGLRGCVRAAEPGFGYGRLVLRGRLLASTRCALPFDFEVAGDFEPNARFDGPVHDARFDEIAVALFRATPKLFGELTAHAQMLVLQRIVFGAYEEDLLGALGHDRDRARALLAGRGLNVRADDPFGLTLAGRLATERLFDGHSLIELIQAPQAPLFSSEPSLKRTDRRVLDLGQVPKMIIKHVRPDAGEASETLQHEAAYQAFLDRGPYIEDPSLETIWRHTVTEPTFSIELVLLRGDDLESPNRESVDFVFVLGDRVLARETWTAPIGTWLAVARSDRFRPDPMYRRVVVDDTYNAVAHVSEQHMKVALDDWYASQVARGFVDPEDAHMFVLVAAYHRDPVFPVLRFDGTNWARGLATEQDLRAVAQGGGGRLQWVRPGEGFAGLFVPGDLVLEARPATLEPHGFIDVKFTQVGPNTVSVARREYASRAPHCASLSDALLQWRGSVNGFDVQIGMYRGEARLQVEFMWLRRILERAVVDAPGRFVAVVAGNGIVANDEMTAVSEGREQALDAVRRAMGHLIEDACLQIADRGQDRLPKKLDRMRLELLDIATRTPADAPWHDPLMGTPLVATAGGRRSLREERALHIRPDRGLLGRVEELLEAARGDRRELLADFTLASMRWSEPSQERLCEANAQAVTVQSEHPLVKLAADGDEVAAAFVASCVYTRINAYYAEITDTDEIAFQHRLLEVRQ